MHDSSTISVIVACTFNLIPIDMFDPVKLSGNIARVEDKLQILVNEYNTTRIQN
jgi:hypothetical protein